MPFLPILLLEKGDNLWNGIIAVEEGLSSVNKNFLVWAAYEIVKPDASDKVDAVVETRMDINVMDISKKHPVVDVRGKTDAQIYSRPQGVSLAYFNKSKHFQVIIK